MEYIESSISENYAQVLRMLNAQRLHEQGKKLSVADAVVLSFDKYDFDEPDKKLLTEFPIVIDGLRDLQYIQRILDWVINQIMTKNDTCDATIRIIHKREDGLCLGYIESLTCGPSIFECDNFLSGDYTGYDIDYDSDMPRLCLVKQKSLCDAGYIPDWTNPEILSINFYKGGRNMTKPCYHYFNESIE